MTADRDLGIQLTELKREAASGRKVTVPIFFNSLRCYAKVSN